MNIIFVLTVALLSLLSFTNCAVTPSDQCEGYNFEDLRERIEVLPCGKSKCKLRKGTNTTVNFRFKPTKEVKQLRNEVSANILGIPLPFVGVDGQNACEQVKNADDGTPASCPLSPGKEYLYTNVFPIERFYPNVPLRVHWALVDGNSKVICFEVPAIIT